MNRKNMLFLFLLTQSFFSFGQKENDLGQLINDWSVVAKLDSNGIFKAIGKNEIRFSLYIKSDSTVTLYQSYFCPEGNGKKGTWSVNSADKVLRLHFTELLSIGRDDYDSIPIQETLTFKITKINIYELVLTQVENSLKKTYFLKHAKF